MDIRKACEGDIDDLLALNKQIGEYHYQHAPDVFTKPSEAEKEFLINALNDTDRLFLVASLGDHVIGFLTATINKNESIPFLSKESICRINTIVVDQDYRKRGIGHKLILSCDAWAVKLGAHQVRLEVMEFNESAQQFYEKLGFKTSSKILTKSIAI
jgi:ribosomal protein S18 acetylase RimI-like enzyme